MFAGQRSTQLKHDPSNGLEEEGACSELKASTQEALLALD